MMILIVMISAVFTGIFSTFTLSCFEKERLMSLSRDENNMINPNLKWWIFLSFIHVIILFSWATLLDVLSIIQLKNYFDSPLKTCIGFLSYWILFESWYWCSHKMQHSIKCCGKITGHKGNLSNKFHHGMKPPYGPDYLTAFASHPLDAFNVQLAAQSPWILAKILYLFTEYQINLSFFTYYLIISWLTFLGMRAHSRNSFGGKFHCLHHDDPSKGPYSFSGVFDHLYQKIST